MSTEFHDEAGDDNTSFWNKEPGPMAFRGPSRLRRWLVPGLTAVVLLVLVIAVGAVNSSTLSRLWSAEQRVSNLTEGLSSSRQLATDTAKDVQRLKFAVESNNEQLSSVSDALKQLAVLDSISRAVAKLKCDLQNYINNSSLSAGCCPLDWQNSGSSCYFYSRTTLSWHEARDWCNAHQAQLAVLLSDAEWDFVTSHSSGSFYWIGLTDEKNERWEWVNQTPYAMDRRRWKPGQPDSWTRHGLGPGDEDCAHLHSDGRLNDLHCSSRLRYICQRRGGA
ncbi:asialoglycoprotein receptor 2-like [Menidia menidia]